MKGTLVPPRLPIPSIHHWSISLHPGPQAPAPPPKRGGGPGGGGPRGGGGGHLGPPPPPHSIDPSLVQLTPPFPHAPSPPAKQMVDHGEQDDKVIAVHADDPAYKDFNDISELPPHRLAEIRR